ncbi:hypothetical protein TKK_0009440 [Trichogramma kaykai]
MRKTGKYVENFTQKIYALISRQPSKSQLRRCRKKETRNRHRLNKKNRIQLLRQLYHGQISQSGPIAKARQALEEERHRQEAERHRREEMDRAVTEAQIRARRRLKATEEEYLKEQRKNQTLKREYTNQWIARSFGTLPIKRPEEVMERPKFPTCRIPLDDVLQLDVEKWDQTN